MHRITRVQVVGTTPAVAVQRSPDPLRVREHLRVEIPGNVEVLRVGHPYVKKCDLGLVGHAVVDSARLGRFPHHAAADVGSVAAILALVLAGVADVLDDLPVVGVLKNLQKYEKSEV